MLTKIERVYVDEISPKQATNYLKRNFGNRPMNMNRVEELKNIILNGEWNFKKSRISFFESGRLLNGQHRLKAIELSGVTVQSVIEVHKIVRKEK